MSILEHFKRQARRLKTELYALSLAYRDPRVPCLIPQPVMAEYRARVELSTGSKPQNWAAAVVIMAIWICLEVFIGRSLITHRR